jgi:hypothetical protein
MKRTFVLTIIASCFLFVANAQLANTKWKGVIRIPVDSLGTLRPFGVTWVFTKDTASVLYDDNTMEPEVMTYKTAGSNIMLRKVSGSVPCNTTDLLTCTYSIKNDQLLFKMVSDECKARAHADASAPFDRVK